MDYETMDDTRNGNGTAQQSAEPRPANENATAEASSLEERLAAAEAEAAEFKDKALRALAEVENIRRRAQREREDAVKYGISSFARELLSAADNLRRAVTSVPEGQATDEATRNLLAGVAATERELLAAFEKHGIRRIDPKGERFDHNFHQAIFEAENTGKPAGTVVEVLQPGYVLHDRLLRPAMVGVAKGGAPAGEPVKPGDHVDTRA
ncbi:MAG: nucleotide exchange factor GrpE [Alphaproteobacteria bacterium]|nr:nucleotide exchange factor GrpE [Alphaproteobacteria bacterium]